MYKWTCAAQTHVIQGSTAYAYTYRCILFLIQEYETFKSGLLSIFISSTNLTLCCTQQATINKTVMERPNNNRIDVLPHQSLLIQADNSSNRTHILFKGQ